MGLFDVCDNNEFNQMVTFARNSIKDNTQEQIIRDELFNILSNKNKYLTDKIIERQVNQIIRSAKKIDFGIQDKEISFCENELNYIHSLNRLQDEHVVFVLFCLYKCYGDLFKYKDSLLYKEANVNRKSINLDKFVNTKQDKLFYIRKKENDIVYAPTEYTKSLYDGNNVLIIKNKKNIVFYYDEYFNNDTFFRCEKCGCIEKKRSNSQKYCKECANMIKNNISFNSNHIISCSKCNKHILVSAKYKRDLCDDCYREKIRENDRLRKRGCDGIQV